MSQPHRRLFKVEPFKFKVQMDPQYAEKTWKFLESAIQQIYDHNASGLSFEELYRNAYNMVMHKHGDKLYSGIVNTMTAHLQQVSSGIESAQGGLFLEETNREWAEHNKSLQMIRDILMYMDRTYVVQNHKTPVHELGLNLWRDHVLRSPQIRFRLIDTLLELVKRERLGESIERGLVRNVIKMFVDLGTDVYESDFERPFLDSATDFYAMESQKLLESSDCSNYLKAAEQRLHEEMERVGHYLDKRTEVKITTVVDREMIVNHMKILVEMENSGMVHMLLNDKYEDLGRMYTLFKRCSTGLRVLRDVLSSHLKETGKQLVTDPEKSKDPLEFVQKLMDMKDKYNLIVARSFDNNLLLQNSLNMSFEHFINLFPRSPEFLSLFVDDKLRKGLKGGSEEDFEVILDKVIVLFRFLQEKDIFEKYYKQHLAKRLLSGRTLSDDAERSFLVKLKTECGYQFTSKLEGMFMDMKTSSDMMQGFHSAISTTDSGSCSENLSESPSLSVQVLTTGSWPIQPGARCNLPSEVLPICERFRQYYLSTHTGRRLTWQPNMGTADIKLNLESRKYEITVSTYQMCILMLFNNSDRLSYQDIEVATDIPTQDLIRNLQSLSLVKGRNVLRKEPMTKDVNEDDYFIFNESFSSKLFKIKIGTVAAQKESEPEKLETRQKVEEDRKPQIEAAIVRIMKSRRVLDHNNIISEVTKQLQARFLPNPSVIKKRIESLIEREFLERDKSDRKLYRYLA